MNERYEKRGVTTRLEANARGRSVITLREGGFAELTASEFTCGPLAQGSESAGNSPATAAEIAEKMSSLSRGLAVLERMSVVEGKTGHRLVAGATRRRWEDASARLFVSLVRQPCGRRAALSLGANTLARIDLAPVSSVCQAFALPESPEPVHAPSLTLEPWVSASLVRVMANDRMNPGQGLRIVQEPPADARDGRGRKIRRRVVRQSSSPWPDCFRPSYRFAPLFTPLHVDLTGADDAGARLDFVAVALASTWIRRGDLLLARAWVVDRLAGSVSFSGIVVDPGAMSRSTVAATGAASWMPEGAGAWGKRLTLKRPAARVQSA